MFSLVFPSLCLLRGSVIQKRNRVRRTSRNMDWCDATRNVDRLLMSCEALLLRAGCMSGLLDMLWLAGQESYFFQDGYFAEENSLGMKEGGKPGSQKPATQTEIGSHLSKLGSKRGTPLQPPAARAPKPRIPRVSSTQSQAAEPRLGASLWQICSSPTQSWMENDTLLSHPCHISLAYSR